MDKQNKNETETQTNSEAVTPAAQDDLFNLESLRLSQDYTAKVAVKKVITTVPVRKPNKHEFVRVRAGESWRVAVYVLEDGIEKKMYLVRPEIAAQISNELKPKLLAVAINAQGVVFLWPINLPQADGKTNTWNDSAMEAARLAERGYVRVVANQDLGAYEVFTPKGTLPEPNWPDELSLQGIIKIAFKGLMIDSMEHPILKRLRGETS